MKATLLTIGDELLIGQVVDTNSAWIGQALFDIGIQVARIESLPDDHSEILAGLARASQSSDLVLITGGLGPTKDDITKQVLCEFMECGVAFSDSTYNRIQRLFAKRNIKMTDAHRDQCMMPEKAHLLINQLGTAPGMWFEQKDVVYVSMPGVPHEMKYLMANEVVPRLSAASNEFLAKRTIRTVGIPESSLAEIVEPILPKHDVGIAYLPSRGQVRLRLYKNGAEQAQIQQQVDAAVAEIVAAIGRPFYGYDEDTLESAVGTLIRERGLQLATAESCTGGYLAHQITSVAGSSAYFQGSIIAYANEVKSKSLNVPAHLIATHGAVSTEVTEAMLEGLLKAIPADLGIAISGVAGPGGGTPEKPVGTVCITVGNRTENRSKQILVGKNRLLNIQYASTYALNMLRKFLLEH